MCDFNPADALENVFDSAAETTDSVMEPVGNTVMKTDEIDQIMESDAVQVGFPALVMGILGGGAGEALGFLGAEAGAADVAAGTSDIGVGVGGAGEAGGTTLAEGAAGVSTSGGEYLQQPAETQALGANAAPAAGSSSAGASMPPAGGAMPPAVVDAPAVAAMNQPSAGGGLISGAMDWAKANPGLTAGILQVGGGALQGVANRESAKETQEKKIQAEREAALAKLENQRAFVQSGSYFGAKVPFRPGANTALRRPDGTAVYSSPGLVAAAMK